MVNYRSVAIGFAVLTVIFAGATGYFATNPTTVVSTSVVTSTLPAATVTNTVTASSSATSYSVTIAYKAGLGFYLTNASGYTLYLRKSDTQSPLASTCTGACITTWPAFYATNIKVPSELNASGFTAVTRTDGKQQLAYEGWPLYYFSKDTAPGQTNGQGLAGVWYACCNIPPVTTTTTTTGSATSSTSTTVAPPGAPISILNGAGTNTNSPGYSPATITVVPGVNGTITWTNNDSTSHTVTSVNVPTGAQTFDSGNMAAGAKFSVTFTVPGTYTYTCSYHAWMMGTVIVK